MGQRGKEPTLLGIDPERVPYKGYAATKPVISDEEIDTMKTEGEKEMAYFKNKLVEIKITKP